MDKVIDFLSSSDEEDRSITYDVEKPPIKKRGVESLEPYQDKLLYNLEREAIRYLCSFVMKSSAYLPTGAICSQPIDEEYVNVLVYVSDPPNNCIIIGKSNMEICLGLKIEGFTSWSKDGHRKDKCLLFDEEIQNRPCTTGGYLPKEELATATVQGDLIGWEVFKEVFPHMSVYCIINPEFKFIN